jgi:hypothetical protein
MLGAEIKRLGAEIAIIYIYSETTLKDEPTLSKKRLAQEAQKP